MQLTKGGPGYPYPGNILNMTTEIEAKRKELVELGGDNNELLNQFDKGVEMARKEFLSILEENLETYKAKYEYYKANGLDYDFNDSVNELFKEVRKNL